MNSKPTWRKTSGYSATSAFFAWNGTDDEPFDDFGELLAQLLRTIGQSVTVASNVKVVVRMVLEERPQVVFLDLVNGLDGCEVARQLPGSFATDRGLVLIALSRNNDEESRRRAVEAGVDQYLVKPIGVAAFLETLTGLPCLTRIVHFRREPVEAGTADSAKKNRNRRSLDCSFCAGQFVTVGNVSRLGLVSMVCSESLATICRYVLNCSA